MSDTGTNLTGNIRRLKVESMSCWRASTSTKPISNRISGRISPTTLQLTQTKNINNILINSIGTVNFLTNAAEETFFRLDDDVEFIKLGRLLSSDDPKATDDDDNEGDGDNVNLIFGVITDCIRHGLRNTWRKNISSIPGCRTK